VNIFIDTSAFLAVLDEGDAGHARAAQAWKDILSTDAGLVTTNHARGAAREESDIDLAVIAPEFDARNRERLTRKLWAFRATTDNRIEPIAVGRTQGLEDQGSPIIEIVRREGISISVR